MPTRCTLFAFTLLLALTPLSARMALAQPAHPDGGESTIFFRASETMLVSYPPARGKPRIAAGWDLPEGWQINNFAMSQDGQRLWLVLLNLAEKANPWQIWSLKTDGSDARQTPFTPEGKLPGPPIVQTGRDGSTAWFFAARSYDYQVYQATPGAAARLVFDNTKVKDMDLGEFPNVTADGKSLLFTVRGRGIVRLESDGSTRLVLKLKDVTYDKAALADRTWSLAINADGSQFAFHGTFSSPKGESVVVRKTPAGIKLHVDPTPNKIAWGVFNDVHMSDDGETVLIRKGETNHKALLLWRGDKIIPVRADVPETHWGLLAGNGKTLYGAAGNNGFLEDLATGKRRRIVSEAIANRAVGNHRLSHDASVLASLYDWHIFLFRAGSPPADYPVIKNVRQRYDEKNRLVVTAEIESKEPLNRVSIQPLVHGYLDTRDLYKTQTEDPLTWARNETLAPDAKRPGVYRAAIDLVGKHRVLGDAFSLRVIALNAGRNKATYVDVPVLTNLQYAPFPDFLKSVEKAKFEDYKGKPGVRVTNAAEFNKMKDYLQTLYKDVPVTHTFVAYGGQHIDCVAIDKQPGALAEVARGNKLQLTPPALHGMPALEDDKKAIAPEALTPQLVKGEKDTFGKEMFCPEGSIPMWRVTLEEVTRFPKLSDFFQKHETGSPLPPVKAGKKDGTRLRDRRERDLLNVSLLGPFPETHRYAHAFQDVPNFGGSSWLNLWRPVPTFNQFSLSQQWFTGGDPIQTVEGGWQVYPTFYGNDMPCLFIFWTADGYNNTGAYNLTKPGFIQVSNAYILGAPWNRWSTTNSTQWGFQMTWYRDPANGNWWLFLGGDRDRVVPVGFYPRSLFGTGQMSKFATRIDFGGEVTGQTASGQMGSGNFADVGFGRAAYQADIYYFPSTGKSAWAELFPHLTNPLYYTIDLRNVSKGSGTHFYFGGPGGP